MVHTEISSEFPRESYGSTSGRLRRKNLGRRRSIALGAIDRILPKAIDCGGGIAS